MFISSTRTVTFGPSGGRGSSLQAGDEEWTWKADTKSCAGAVGTADRRDKGMGLLQGCWIRATPKGVREGSVVPSSTTTQRPSGLLFWSACVLLKSYLAMSNVGDPAVYQGRHRTYPMSPLFVFSGREIRLPGPLGAMGRSTGDLITAGRGP